MKRNVFQTEDGTSSIRVPELDETYHSKHGAVIESTHVYIDSGLKFLNRPHVKIFEMGFGTGLNAYLSLLYANENRIKIEYVTVEKYPLQIAESQQLNYPEQLKQSRSPFDRLHACTWNSTEEMGDYFSIHKLSGDLKDMGHSERCNLIYYDAFGPDVQSNLWTLPIMQNMYKLLDINGILVTYSAKGQVRRNLVSAGFTVERIPGPPGKREILRATKK